MISIIKDISPLPFSFSVNHNSCALKSLECYSALWGMKERGRNGQIFNLDFGVDRHRQWRRRHHPLAVEGRCHISGGWFDVTALPRGLLRSSITNESPRPTPAIVEKPHTYTYIAAGGNIRRDVREFHACHPPAPHAATLERGLMTYKLCVGLATRLRSPVRRSHKAISARQRE